MRIINVYSIPTLQLAGRTSSTNGVAQKNFDPLNKDDDSGGGVWDDWGSTTSTEDSDDTNNEDNPWLVALENWVNYANSLAGNVNDRQNGIPFQEE